MIDVVMPQMGESIVEGTLTKWLKKKGDHVERDEPLFEISTDKVDTEIPAPVGGRAVGRSGGGRQDRSDQHRGRQDRRERQWRVGPKRRGQQPMRKPRKRVEAAKTTDVGPSVAAKTAGAARSRPAPPQQPVANSAGPYPIPAPEPRAGRSAETRPDLGPLSPLVRKMAREYNIDLHQVKGTGAGGRITKQDVEAYMSAQGAKTMAQSATKLPLPLPGSCGPLGSAPSARSGTASASSAAGTGACISGSRGPSGSSPGSGGPRTRIEPMSTMRQKIAEHMVMSKHTSAHVTTVHRVDMTKVAKVRERTEDRVPAAQRLLADLSCRSSREPRSKRCGPIPILNASIDGTNIVYHNDINIGIAVALENGLIVPVIANADEKNVTGLQRSIVDLSTRARSRQLKPRGSAGRHVLHHQFRQLRQRLRHPGDQPAASRDPGRRRRRKGAGRGGRRRHRHPLAVLPGADVRPSPDRRRAGRPVHRQSEECLENWSEEI